MKYNSFIQSTKNINPPSSLTQIELAVWHVMNNNWDNKRKKGVKQLWVLKSHQSPKLQIIDKIWSIYFEIILPSAISICLLDILASSILCVAIINV